MAGIVASRTLPRHRRHRDRARPGLRLARCAALPLPAARRSGSSPPCWLLAAFTVRARGRGAWPSVGVAAFGRGRDAVQRLLEPAAAHSRRFLERQCDPADRPHHDGRAAYPHAVVLETAPRIISGDLPALARPQAAPVRRRPGDADRGRGAPVRRAAFGLRHRARQGRAQAAQPAGDTALDMDRHAQAGGTAETCPRARDARQRTGAAAKVGNLYRHLILITVQAPPGTRPPADRSSTFSERA